MANQGGAGGLWSSVGGHCPEVTLTNDPEGFCLVSFVIIDKCLNQI